MHIQYILKTESHIYTLKQYKQAKAAIVCKIHLTWFTRNMECIGAGAGRIGVVGTVKYTRFMARATKC